VLLAVLAGGLAAFVAWRAPVRRTTVALAPLALIFLPWLPFPVPAAFLAWTGPIAAAAPEKAVVTVANVSNRIVDCGVVIDGRARTYLRIRPGKSWTDSFDPRRTVQLVCERTVSIDGVFRVQPGASYRLIDVKGKIDIEEGAE